ncbi:mitogen-activated protein kinase kinase [Ranunculus cassubicifolius]
MDFVSPVIDIVYRLFGCSTKHAKYFCELERNLQNLRNSINELKELRFDVERRVNSAESRLMKRTYLVDGWLQRVEALIHQADPILLAGSQQLERRRLSGCWTKYKLGKKVVEKLSLVENLQSKGDAFGVVAESYLPSSVLAVPENPTIGLDSTFLAAWSFLGDDDVGIMGLYGMGGVGKTTLLRKINNGFVKRRHDFDLVIWVVISKEVDLEKVQYSIGERLGFSWSDTKDLASRAQDIFNVLMRKRFVLLLDDIWERLDLLSIGIPQPDSVNNSKIVFTTRSETVCGRMEADKKIRVECLNWDQAWTLFQKKVGQEALNFNLEILKLAQRVAKECCGLPLALITIGRSMAGKNTPQEWKHAIATLQKSAAEFSGMGDEVLPLLKFSYDNLPNDTMRSCFLYCSLYPEDCSISVERLIECWMGEGYIDGLDDSNDARNTGHYIIGSLKSFCLLEIGEVEDLHVKMHDVIRDLAMWIACECGKERDKVLVRTGYGLTEVPKVEKWSRPQRISLMSTSITQLDYIPHCPNLLSLLVVNNISLHHIHNDFFHFMPLLRFLDLSKTGITNFPTSITDLVELEFLNLSETLITELPHELMKLTKLKYLFLGSKKLQTIPHGVVMHLSNLQMLKLHDHYLVESEQDVEAGIEELGSLNNLSDLEITLSSMKVVDRFLSHPRLVLCTTALRIARCVDILSVDLSPPTSPPSSSLHLCIGRMTKLRELRIFHCDTLEELKLDWLGNNRENGLVESLEIMGLYRLPKLIISWDVKTRSHDACFRNLHHVFLHDCGAMVNLTWLLFSPNIRTLRISNCPNVKEIVSDGSGECDIATFSNLKTLSLYDMPSLWSICTSVLRLGVTG